MSAVGCLAVAPGGKMRNSRTDSWRFRPRSETVSRVEVERLEAVRRQYDPIVIAVDRFRLSSREQCRSEPTATLGLFDPQQPDLAIASPAVAVQASVERTGVVAQQAGQLARVGDAGRREVEGVDRFVKFADVPARGMIGCR